MIDILIAQRGAGDTRRYPDSKTGMERYLTVIAPRLFSSQTVFFNVQSAVRQYLAGKSDAEGFADVLNQAMAKCREEPFS